MKIIEKSIEGYFKETINVGDRVVVLTMHAGTPSLSRGIYLGYEDQVVWGQSRKFAKVEYDRERFEYTNQDGSEFKDWNSFYEWHRELMKDIDSFDYSIDYFAIYCKENNVTKSVVKYKQKSTLQLNRMIKDVTMEN